ncbi:MAG: QueT transporter family protein [Lachnospiraceae bacterium]|nr:QueT transporter family protein [Lachnospiraceae bacterium]
MNRVRFLTQAAMIAAIYVVLTMLANAMGLASYAIQVRFSEALTILPFFTAAAVPGLAVGCLISNILAGGALLDIVFGTIATLIGAVCTYLLRKKSKWLAPVPPIIANAVIVPPVLYGAYGISPIWLSVITVTIGEIISCGILGMLLLHGLLKYRRIFDLQA